MSTTNDPPTPSSAHEQSTDDNLRVSNKNQTGP